MAEFKEFPKMQRLYDNANGIVITEKIDGTNGAIQIENGVVVAVQSRKRIITPQDDNFGFASWVYSNQEEIARALGDGIHFGEWYGSGIQRGYGLTHGKKRFALFNTSRWTSDDIAHVEGLELVPELYRGDIKRGLDSHINNAVAKLLNEGSQAQPGFMNPEGIVVFFLDSRVGFKHIPEGWEPKSKKNTRG